MRHGVRVVILAGMTALVMACGNALAQNAVLRSGAGQSVHALIIGIDAYQNVRPLKGAAADARDIEVALRNMGVADVVSLIDEQANRDNLLKSIDQLLQRIKPGDLVVFSIAGHGAQEPERVKGSQPDGKDDIFLLAGFGLTGTASQQRIIGREFNYFIKQFESRGATVLFVADTCHGGGLTREVDPRGGELSYRQVPQYTLVVDELRPVGAPADAFLTRTDFERTAFLAAVDRATKAPEVRIPGIEGYRGALSYAVARAIEGKADADHDGKTTLQELFTDVTGLVYQLSNQRQNAVAVASLSQKPDSDVAFRTYSPMNPQVATTPRLRVSAVAEAVEPAANQAVKVAAANASAAVLAGLERRETPIRVVASATDADLIWDAKSKDVISHGDVIAYGIDKSDLSSVVDRAAAVSGIKHLVAKAPQAVAVKPDDTVHHDNKKVVVEIGGVAGRALVLFNLSSDGTVQMLYPVRNDTPIIADALYRLPIVVRSPYGADQVVAVTSEQRMLSLEQALQQLNGRRAPLQAMRMVERYMPRDSRVGSVGLFTAP
jgi:hypothetical protein